MKDKLQSIYDFLENNREYNKEFQEKEYKKIIFHHSTTEDKIVSLLYNIANSQSQPKIDYLAEFFRHIYKNIDKLQTFESFVSFISANKDASYKNLFDGLSNQNGWGDKTSALFTKAIYNIHHGQYDEKLKIWADAPKINQDDIIFLPVDSVIIHIFRKIGLKKPSFKSINALLKANYTSKDMIAWDDLWFWGFITQKGSGNERSNKWNPNKYWALEHSVKNKIVIDEIQKKSNDFLKLLTSKSTQPKLK